MKKTLLYAILITLFIQSCQNVNQQEELVNKKWYSSKIDCIEFNNKHSYILYHREVKIREVPYKFTDENKFKLTDTITGKELEYFFEVKDSILMFCDVENTMHQNKKIDTFFLHLNSKYEYWQRRELYYYGKIISEKDPNPSPYIYFEF